MKKIGNTVYFHVSKINDDDVIDTLGTMNWFFISEIIDRKLIPIEPTIIKWDKKKEVVTYINSPDWDVSREPVVGDGYRCEEFPYWDGKIIKSKGQIYHHKWMFVNEDYQGFNVEESKKWSDTWTKVIPKELKTKIGYKKNWDKILKEYGL